MVRTCSAFLPAIIATVAVARTGNTRICARFEASSKKQRLLLVEGQVTVYYPATGGVCYQNARNE